MAAVAASIVIFSFAQIWKENRMIEISAKDLLEAQEQHCQQKKYKSKKRNHKVAWKAKETFKRKPYYLTESCTQCTSNKC
jgi:hypothetical protein